MILKKNEETDEFTLLVEHLVGNDDGKHEPVVQSPLNTYRRKSIDWR